MPASLPVKTYWQNALKGFSKPTSMAGNTRYKKEDSGGREYSQEHIVIPQPLAEKLFELSRQSELEVSAFFQAMTACLASFYSNDLGVIFGCSVNRRSISKKTISSPLPICIQTGLSKNVCSWIDEINHQWLEIQNYKNVSLADIKEWSNWDCHLSLFDILLVIAHSTISKQNIQNVCAEYPDIPFLMFVSIDNGLTLTIHYDDHAFESNTFSTVLCQCQSWLENLCSQFRQPLSTLCFLSDAEHQKLLIEWNQTKTEYPRNQTIQDVFEQQTQHRPDNVAVILPDLGGQSYQQLTYQELHQRANRLARVLQQQGVQPGTYVAVMMERTIEMIVALLGILKAGGVYVPLEPAYPSDRLEWMLTDTQAPVILTQQHLVEQLPPHQAAVLCFETGWGSDLTAEAQAPASIKLDAEAVAYINYTSGSTGRPKGVAIPHRAVLRLVFGNDYTSLDTHQTWLQLAPISFDAATLEIWGALLQGGRCVLFPGNGLPDPQDLKAVISHHQVTSLWLTSSLFNTVIAECPQALQGVQEVLTGGEALSVSHVRQAQAQLPNTQFVNGYGPTENTTFTCCYRIPARLPTNLTSIPIGRPIGNTQVYILDAARRPVPIGMSGELYVGGDGLATEYINRPDLTQSRFVRHPFSDDPQARLYRTGDLVRYLPDGNIEFMGRVDHQVKISGYRIELGEIESTLRQHDAVRDAVVIVDETSPAQKRLVGYVTAVADVRLDVSQVQHYLRQGLPEYMVPAKLIVLEAIPLTPNGKVDKQSLPKSRFEATAHFIAPRTPMEKSLSELWCAVLGLEQVGIEDNFFDVGGTSILSLQVATRLTTQLGQTVRAVKLYQYPTIRTLASYLSQAQQPAVVPDPKRKQQKGLSVAEAEIAIVGMVGRYPGAHNVEELWSNLCNGLESITFFAEDEIDPSVDLDLRTDPNYVRAKGMLQGAESFDAGFFGISPRQAEIMDPQARLFLELAQEALENSGHTPSQYSGRVGLYAGSGQNTYFERHLCGRSDIINRLGAFQTMLANEKDFVTTRTSYKLDLTGPSVSVSTACSTSLVATIQAFQGLINHDCDLALAGGISITTPQNTGYLYQEEGILSADGHCQPFDAQAQGTTFNSGAGIVVLKRLADALEEGDRIYAVLKGVGINNDGAGKVSFTAPSVDGQAAAIEQAQAQAGFTPDSMSYIEAHGTATSLGDPIEVEALTQAFQQHTQATQYCAMGSIKGNIGHTVAAAGVAGLIKTALALYYKTIPPSIGFTAPNPQIDFQNSPFYVNTQLTAWPASRLPRRAGVSSFGVGGTNAHVVLEEPPDLAPSSPSRPQQLLLLSAKTPSALDQATSNLHQFFQNHKGLNLADVAYTLQVGRQAYNHRRFVLCQSWNDASQGLETLDGDRSGTRQTVHRDPDIVFVFPGQGSQYVNMGLNFYQSEPVFQSVVDQCAEYLQSLLKLDIRTLLYPEQGQEVAAAELKKTIYTQPALFVVEYALAQLWMSWGIRPAAMMGHSIGEFVAACLAGVYSLEDGLKLIAARGQMMWDLPAGSMLSVRAAVDQVQPYLSDQLAIAAINSPGLCTISGPTPDILALEVALTTQEIPCKTLHTSHAFHSPMMDELVSPFKALVQNISLSPPQIPFVSTATAHWITDTQATDPQYWANHLRATVRFADSIQTLWQQSDRVLLEVGPRATTTTLARQQITDKQAQIAIASLSNTAADHQEWIAILKAMGQLWLAGTEVNWQTFYQNEYRHRLPLPTYPFERQRFWIDPLPAYHTPNVTDPSPPSTPFATNRALPTPCSIEKSHPESPMSETQPQRLSPLIVEILESSSGLDLSNLDEQVTFLEMGLDSLSLTQVALSLKKKFKVKISFRNLLEEYCTVQSVAAYLDQSLPADAFPALVPVPPDHIPSVAAPTQTSEVSPTAAPQPITTSPIDSSQASAVETLVAQQLQILSQQLALLTQARQGGPAASTVATPQGTAQTQPSPSAQTVVPQESSSEPVSKSHGPGAKIQKSQDISLSAQQRVFLDQLIADYTARTPESKRQTQEHRPYLADPRTVSGFTPLLKEMIYPLVIEQSSGSKLWDVDGNEYIDLTNGFGLNFFGWNPDFVTQAVIEQLQKGIEIGPQHPLAGRVAKLISEFTGMDRVAFCNTGSEAVMASLRLARTVTGRDLVVTFKGDYHGTFDEVLYRPGAKQKTLPAAPGIMPSMFENLLVLDYGTSASLEILRQQAENIAAVLVEPVRSRDPGLQPQAFLQELRQITEQSETALIFDEVVTGFRIHPGGAQAYFGVQADLATYGKVVGGGLPIGIVAGKADYMDALDGGQWQFGDDSVPEVGVTFFAGTFVRHPLALAAAEAVLTKLKDLGPKSQEQLAEKVSQFTNHLSQYCQQVGAPVFIKSFSSFFYITYADEAPYGGLLFYLLRNKGVHVWEYRPCFFTLAHTDADIAFVIQAFKDSVSELQAAGLLPGQTIPEKNGGQSQNQPPCLGARLGRDPQGNPAWFIADPDRPGQYLQVAGVS